MLGFLSSQKESSGIVTKDKIAFVHLPDNSSNDEIKMLISQKAKLFADTLNLNEVYLHFGKEVIEYEFKV